MGRTPASVTREHILDVADELFYRHGARAVGMDEVVRRAGLGKMTLYRQFSTKDLLAVAVVERRHEKVMGDLEDAVRNAIGPRAQLDAIIASVAADITSPTFHGCPFQNTVSDFRAPDHPARTAVRAHQEALLARLHDLAFEAGATGPKGTAEQLLVLINGAYATARVLDPDIAAHQLESMAGRLLDLHLPTSASPRP
jgi:AcrR family transcriptional regulator